MYNEAYYRVSQFGRWLLLPIAPYSAVSLRMTDVACNIIYMAPFVFTVIPLGECFLLSLLSYHLENGSFCLYCHTTWRMVPFVFTVIPLGEWFLLSLLSYHLENGSFCLYCHTTWRMVPFVFTVIPLAEWFLWLLLLPNVEISFCCIFFQSLLCMFFIASSVTLLTNGSCSIYCNPNQRLF